MRQNSDNLSYVKPSFGVIALVRHNLEISSSEFCRRLLEEKKIAVIPCDECFPDLRDGDRYLRMSYCHPPAIMEETLRNVAEALNKYARTKRAEDS